MAQQINGVHHIGMSVPSLDAARAFYVGLLGLEELSNSNWTDSPVIDRLLRLSGTTGKLMFLATGNTYIEVFEFAAPASVPLTGERPVNAFGFTHLCLDVDDTDAIHARLKAAGMDFHCDPISASGVRTVYGRDPFGNVIELQQVVEEGMVPRIPAALATKITGGNHLPRFRLQGQHSI